MFYVKEEINGVLERIEIHDENVYCECPYCMKEQLVDISEIISTGGDLCVTSVICSECVKKEKELETRAKQIGKEARELFESCIYKPSSLEEIENNIATKVEYLVKEYWNEVLYRDEAEIDE